MESKDKLFSRREAVKKTALVSALSIAPWLLAACSNSEPKKVPTIAISSGIPKPEIPNLNLNISESAWEAAIAKKPDWQILPESRDEKNLLCPTWAKDICMGKIGPSFKIAVNKPLFELMLNESGLRNPLLHTQIAFVDDWFDSKLESNMGHGGGSTFTESGGAQLIVIWMKYAAWRSFKIAEQQKLSVDDYFNGIVSQMASKWLVHEMAHAGRENKNFWDIEKKQFKIDIETVHPQIHEFDRRYNSLYSQAFKQGKAANALVVGVESVGDLNQLRANLYAEAESRNIKFE